MEQARITDPYTPLLLREEFAGAVDVSEDVVAAWYGPVDRAMHMHHIRTFADVCAFLATMCFESQHFTRLEESLDYSTAQRLCDVWPTRFSPGGSELGTRDPVPYLHQPQKLAEYVYSGRMGNGPEGTGDGWAYRGRGPGHTTGRSAYEALGRVFGKDFTTAPDLLKEPLWGSLTSARQWLDKGCSVLANRGDFVGTVVLWNGGRTDITLRSTLHGQITQVLAGTAAHARLTGG